MKMTKTVLAVAIAGIAAAPGLASATTTLSGAVQLQISGSDSEDAHSNLNNDVGFEDGEARITTGDVIVGVNASQATNIGLTAYGSLRIDLDTFSSGDVGSADNVYVGVKGGFGDLRIGEVSNPGEFGQFSDILNDMGTGIDQGIGLTGSFAGATVGLAYSPATNHDLIAVGAKFAWNGLSIGVGLQNQDEANNVSAMVGFSYAGASIQIGGATIEENLSTIDADGNPDPIAEETTIRAKIGYGIAGVALGLTYEAEQESEDSKVRLDASYGLGGGMTVSTRINSTTPNIGDSSSDWRIQFAKSF